MQVQPSPVFKSRDRYQHFSKEKEKEIMENFVLFICSLKTLDKNAFMS